MGRIIHANSIPLPAPLMAGSCDPVDPRTVVQTFEDITTDAATTFGTIGRYCKIYEGILVYVSNEKSIYTFIGTSDKNGVLLAEVINPENWIKTASSEGLAIKNKYITDIQVLGKLLEVTLQLETGEIVTELIDLPPNVIVGSGLTLSNNTINILKDSNPNSKYLNIEADTIGLVGLDEAMDSKINTLNNTISSLIQTINNYLTWEEIE